MNHSGHRCITLRRWKHMHGQSKELLHSALQFVIAGMTVKVGTIPRR